MVRVLTMLPRANDALEYESGLVGRGALRTHEEVLLPVRRYPCLRLRYRQYVNSDLRAQHRGMDRGSNWVSS